MPVTAKSRSQVALTATTLLDVASTLALVKEAASQVKGGGKSLLTSGVANLGAAVHVEAETATGLSMSITSGKRLVELCTFPVTTSASEGKTSLRVGGARSLQDISAEALGFDPRGAAKHSRDTIPTGASWTALAPR